MAETLSYELAKTLTLIPGYDPFATAGDAALDEDRARFAIDFFRECLSHIEGVKAGAPFVLEPWEEAIVGNLFGWYRPDGTRRYRECLIFVPRKNGKTPLAAGIALLHTFCDSERGQQNYIAASTREQAGLMFRQCKGMVDQEPYLASRCRIYGGNASAGQSQSIVHNETHSFLKIVSGDAKLGQHGRNANLALVDELHEQPTPELVQTMRTSMASANKPQPLLIYTTTSDYERPSICNEIHDYACKVRDGLIEDAAFLPVIYEATIDDDWTSPEVWRRVNPNLGVSVSAEYLERECKRAQDSPSFENTFKRLHLNIRTEQDVRWLQMDRWDDCDDAIDLDALEGESCWCGLDLATTTDIAAMVKVFKVGDKYALVPTFWVPKARAVQRQDRDRVPYVQWIREGLITATDGDAIDYDAIERDIIADSKLYKIEEIAADPWNATQVLQHLAAENLVVFEHRQGFASMSGPTKEFEKAVLAGRIIHGGNPVMRWMASNVTVETDAAANLKPSKKKSTEKIDGIVAAIMAVGRAAVGTPEPDSYYETHELEIW